MMLMLIMLILMFMFTMVPNDDDADDADADNYADYGDNGADDNVDVNGAVDHAADGPPFAYNSASARQLRQLCHHSLLPFVSDDCGLLVNGFS